ncbi:MAG: hypothetical protein ACK559_17805, partial [bacterium]
RGAFRQSRLREGVLALPRPLGLAGRDGRRGRLLHLGVGLPGARQLRERQASRENCSEHERLCHRILRITAVAPAAPAWPDDCRIVPYASPERGVSVKQAPEAARY